MLTLVWVPALFWKFRWVFDQTAVKQGRDCSHNLGYQWLRKPVIDTQQVHSTEWLYIGWIESLNLNVIIVRKLNDLLATGSAFWARIWFDRHLPQAEHCQTLHSSLAVSLQSYCADGENKLSHVIWLHLLATGSYHDGKWWLPLVISTNLELDR